MNSLRTENAEEDAEDDQEWSGWLVKSDSDSSPTESDWINVESDGSDYLEISDSGSELAEGEPGSVESNLQGGPPTRMSSLATTKVRNDFHCRTEFRLTSSRYSRQRIFL